jgi:hypothetical protein
LEGKRKLRYYKEVFNPNLEDKKYLFVLTTIKKKINIAKIRINSKELHSEIGHWTIPKTLWVEIICYLCDTKRVENQNNSLRISIIHTHYITISKYLLKHQPS